MLTDIHEKITKAIVTDLLHHTLLEERASHCRLSLVTKPGSTTLNLNPYDIPKEEEIKECAVSWKNHCYSLLR
jgi:hypothetical protein